MVADVRSELFREAYQFYRAEQLAAHEGLSPPEQDQPRNARKQEQSFRSMSAQAAPGWEAARRRQM